MEVVKCPYCSEYHDFDPQDLIEDQLLQAECFNCEKSFTYTVTISRYIEASKAECLNGGEHNFNEMKSMYGNKKTTICSNCGLVKKKAGFIVN